MKRILSAAALLLLLGACVLPEEPEEVKIPIRVSTDQRVYGLPAGVGQLTVSFTVTNVRSSDALVARCGANPAVEVQRRESLQWTAVQSMICPANLDQSPVTLAPGESVSGVVHIDHVSGTFRLLVPLADWGGNSLIAASPTFDVRWTDG